MVCCSSWKIQVASPCYLKEMEMHHLVCIFFFFLNESSSILHNSKFHLLLDLKSALWSAVFWLSHIPLRAPIIWFFIFLSVTMKWVKCCWVNYSFVTSYPQQCSQNAPFCTYLIQFLKEAKTALPKDLNDHRQFTLVQSPSLFPGFTSGLLCLFS